ncbi:uncharacterized protein FTOL_01452 [Fusarium torulosum]|uniref:Heterokaryon incompatibility domain-containing protein n=1 Tax=Fusarium torulosum TaxID=33205 RepID=A0AAE8M079_9HYPO|nr:uncharacterized protein FTOL_01452 [Fusarium torulosum]
MYSALNSSRREIRLLRLFAGSETDAIKCELYTTSLDCPDEYEALSYVWGSPKDPRSITVEGEAKDVTQNLESALRHLRHEDRPRTIWVDALCINQNDVQEKTLQVRQMGSIYSMASLVLVWLGPGENHSDTVRTIRKFAANRDLHWNDTEDRRNFFMLYFFLSRDWWSRVWTVQELVLAKRVTYQCGWESLPESDIHNMALSFSFHTSQNRCCHPDSMPGDRLATSIGPELGATMERLLRLIKFQQQTKKTPLPFDQVSLEFKIREATDPRDKVYGFLGISQGVSTDSINYNLTTAEVFEATTREFLQYRENLDLLSHCVDFQLSRRGKKSSGLPSWVPDWGVERVSMGGDLDVMVYRIPFLDTYKACGQLKYTPSTDLDKGMLSVSGVLCDVIETVGGEVRERFFEGSWSLIAGWRKLVGVDEDPGRPYIAGDTIADAFWRTLCLDISANSAMHIDLLSKKRRAGDEDRSIYLEYWYRELLQHHELPQPDSLRQSSNVIMFDQHVMRATTRRRFFISKNGFIGFAPLNAEVGDMICVFAGGKVPFVVRALEDSKLKRKDSHEPGSHCVLLGDAYVHGLMDGEAVKTLEEDFKQLRTFKLH